MRSELEEIGKRFAASASHLGFADLSKAVRDVHFTMAVPEQKSPDSLDRCIEEESGHLSSADRRYRAASTSAHEGNNIEHAVSLAEIYWRSELLYRLETERLSRPVMSESKLTVEYVVSVVRAHSRRGAYDCALFGKSISLCVGELTLHNPAALNRRYAKLVHLRAIDFFKAEGTPDAYLDALESGELSAYLAELQTASELKRQIRAFTDGKSEPELSSQEQLRREIESRIADRVELRAWATMKAAELGPEEQSYLWREVAKEEAKLRG